jgi:predicted branched-subunit amino acid permease
MLFNLNTHSLCQAVVPEHLLGRVMSVLMVLSYTAIPLGALGGGIIVQGIGVTHVAQVYAVIGLVTCLFAVGFSFTALGHADRYLPAPTVVAPPARSLRWKPALFALTAGMRATVPFAFGVIPPMVLYGVTALQAGLSPVMAQAMSLLVFSGAILPAAQALQAGTPVMVVGLMIVLLNARHVLYSARLALKLRPLRLSQRLLASYLLTDESFGADARGAHEGKFRQNWWWYLIGAGLMVWVVAQGATALGLALGSQVPIWDGMSFIPSLAFICLTALSLKGPTSAAVALAAGAAAILLARAPLGLGLLVAVGVGGVTGHIIQRLARRQELARTKERKAWRPGS